MTLLRLKKKHDFSFCGLCGDGLQKFRLMSGMSFCSPHVCLSLWLLAQLSDRISARRLSVFPAETRREGRMELKERANGKSCWKKENQGRRKDYSQKVKIKTGTKQN